ncbi:ABC transporter permease [Caballeronia sp. GAWG2-1]|uniref:ABC transporter permease n=1 Tax=Caballeronia sp. GAWG2-1 TaxID=2921744 RepID=UPI002027E2DB|nr:ABC transporter permease [Caballeronia sp. GAWG2-1]
MKRHIPPGMAVTIVSAWILIGFLVAPLFVVVPYSLTPERYLSMPDGVLSLRHYRTLVTDSAWIGAIWNSVLVAAGATVIATPVGGAAAIGVWQLGGRVGRVVSALAVLPMVVPSIVTALALSRTWVTLHLFDTYSGVILSHAIIGVPFVFMTAIAALETLDRRTFQAARSLGAGSLRSVRDVVVPNIKTGLISGAVFAFFASWDEIVVTSFVSAQTVFTLPRKIFSDIRDNIDPAVTAISTIMIIVTFAVAVVYLLRALPRAKIKESP